ncbi:WD40 repeat-like protein [Sanghuangporus baumii]|uniref:WD40 repeat-like protein n=1 Tax=Sanghuangporus baumii TaxID=108892 RepID=A0A9Q5HVJ1_SANBA|nr:WD40 repeat-like protein [Sanghuangporus baumii]
MFYPRKQLRVSLAPLAPTRSISRSVQVDDGSVRLYKPPESKVQKAIRGLGASISSVLFCGRADDEDKLDIWIASGKSVYRFDLRSPESTNKMILTRSDASLAKDVGQDDEDVINQISANHAYLACTTDTGGVYILDTSSSSVEVSKMKTSHESIAWTASFIPDRPSELLTGGYDCALLLHDFKLRTLLARFDITPSPALAPGISSLPPFITALALSSQGAVAAGTADGRVWVGLGGVKSIQSESSRKNKSKVKRSRKWGGLNEEEGFFVKVGESLIAGLQFITPDTLLSCTVSGKLELHRLSSNLSSGSRSRQGDMPPGGLQTICSAQSRCAKVDILTSTTHRLLENQEPEIAATFAIAGLHADKKRGAVELWHLCTCPSNDNSNPVIDTQEEIEKME